MTAGIYDYTIEAGFDFSRTLTWKDSSGNVIDLTGWTAESQIVDSAGNTIVDYATDGGITVNGTAGQVTIWLLGAFTGTLTFDTARHYVKLTGPSGSAPDGSSGALDKLVKGVVTLDPLDS